MSVSALDRRRVATAFGAALRTARKQRGLSQEALCEGADLDRTYASLLERGLRTPTLAVILDIAQALGVEATQLISDTIARLREKDDDATTTSEPRRRAVRS
jgi:transcriptional regulator with XRE-family HTH domain